MSTGESTRTVVGFHGVVVPGRSPGLHGPVVVDAMNRLVDGGGVHEDLVIEPDAPLPGDGTRIGPWPYEPNHIVITVDAALLRDARLLFYKRGSRDPTLRSCLDAISHGGVEEMERCLARRVPEERSTVVAWYASRKVVDVLRGLLRDLARSKVERALARGIPQDIEAAAWGLQRAAVSSNDDLFAGAALAASGMQIEEVHEIFRELARDLSEARYQELYAEHARHVGTLLKSQGVEVGAAYDARQRVRAEASLPRAA